MYMICLRATILVRGADDKCDFEIGSCNWQSRCNVRWETSGTCTCNSYCKAPLIPETCTRNQQWNETAWDLVEENSCQTPSKSHSGRGTSSKRYMRIQTYLAGKTGFLVYLNHEQQLTKCIYFWFYIIGPGIKSFGVYVNSMNISSIDVMQREKWYQHVVNINGNQIKEIALIASFEYYNGNGTEDGRCIAVDDVEMKDGDCPESSMSPTTVTTAKSVPASAAKSSSTSNTTGIIVGVVVGIGFIVGLGTLLWCFIRRSKNVGKKSASHDNQISSNDYIGHQSAALSALPNPMSNNDGYTEIHQNYNYQQVNSHFNASINTSSRNYAKFDRLQNLSDNKAGHSLHANGTNHDYIYLDETEARSTQTSIHVPGVNMLNEEIHKSNEYAVIDPNSDHSSGTSLGNYAILDPNETGFFRSKGNKKTNTEYELAVPINENECVSGLHDPYTVSEDGEYDSTNMVRHNEAETNIYNHAVENAYDTSSNERKIVGNEGTYDHFFGDETEDNYNITKRE